MVSKPVIYGFSLRDSCAEIVNYMLYEGIYIEEWQFEHENSFNRSIQ